MTTMPDYARLPVILLLALLINALIFGAIQYMVGNPRMRLDDATNVDIANFIRMTEQSREVRSRRDPKAPEKPVQEQQQQLQQLAQASSGNLSGLAVDIPDVDVELSAEFGSDIAIARELIPLVRIPATYPQRAVQRGIEGYVILRFVVTETGSVEDPEVLRAEPPDVFERSAIRAVLRWKYQPQIKDGKPVRVVSMTKIIYGLVGDEADGED